MGNGDCDGDDDGDRDRDDDNNDDGDNHDVDDDAEQRCFPSCVSNNGALQRKSHCLHRAPWRIGGARGWMISTSAGQVQHPASEAKCNVNPLRVLLLPHHPFGLPIRRLKL